MSRVVVVVYNQGPGISNFIGSIGGNPCAFFFFFDRLFT